MKKHLSYGISLSVATISLAMAAQPADHLVFEGDESKAGKAKHIVFIAGDEEYRSEESLPMLAQIMSKQGFRCTVLFSMDKENKFVDPTNQKSLSNPAALDSADAIVMAIRFRNWPDASMDKFNAAFEKGTPIVALRTSTHAFQIKSKKAKWAKWTWNNKADEFKGGFGRQVLGETWVSHWGAHAKQGTRSIIEEASKGHPVLNGVGTIFGKTDVYEAHPLEPSTVLLKGQITKTLEKDSEAFTEKKGAKQLPIAWVREYKHKNGKTSKILTTTMGSSDDLQDENLRRLVINGVYWGTGLEVPAKTDVTLQSAYTPTMYGYKDVKNDPRRGYRKNQTPSDFLNIEPTAK